MKAIQTPAQTQSQVILHLMINQLSLNNIDVAAKHHNEVVNNIPADLKINADQQQLAVLLDHLLHKALSYTRNSSICVSAKFYSNVMLIHLKGNCSLSDPAFEEELKELHAMELNAGGTVGVTSYRNEITTVALSFCNARLAA